MNTTTFTATFTFPTDSVIGFATFIGYQATIMQPINDPTQPFRLVSVPNPQSAIDYLVQKATEHNQSFVRQWADFLVQQNIETTVKPQLDQQIVQPVLNAVQVTVTQN